MTSKAMVLKETPDSADFTTRFKTEDLSEYPDPRKLPTPLDKVLWVLYVLKHKFGWLEYVTARDISAALYLRNVSINQIQIERALARAGKKISRHTVKTTKAKSYSLITAGEKYFENKCSKGKTTRVLLLEGTKPWSDRHEEFKTFSKSLKGSICVLDKFYGPESFDTLKYLVNAKKVRFLTAQPSGNLESFKREYKDFKTQFPNVEIRVFPNKAELHDRYIISDSRFVIIGHGLKDLGRKESFLIAFDSYLYSDMKATLLEKFESRWAVSKEV